jgi:hypothetical protein
MEPMSRLVELPGAAAVSLGGKILPFGEAACSDDFEQPTHTVKRTKRTATFFIAEFSLQIETELLIQPVNCHRQAHWNSNWKLRVVTDQSVTARSGRKRISNRGALA